MRSVQDARRAISMIEATIASLLVGLVMASTLGLIGPVMRSTEHASNETIARRLADELVAEISTLDFEEPDETAKLDMLDPLLDLGAIDALDAIGPDAGERTSVRTDFDDVDDYNGWSEIPPKNKSGTSYSSLLRWGRQVKVEHVSLNDFSTTSLQRTGAKRITIQVVHNGTLLASETFIRTDSWDAARRDEE